MTRYLLYLLSSSLFIIISIIHSLASSSVRFGPVLNVIIRLLFPLIKTKHCSWANILMRCYKQCVLQNNLAIRMLSTLLVMHTNIITFVALELPHWDSKYFLLDYLYSYRQTDIFIYLFIYLLKSAKSTKKHRDHWPQVIKLGW